MLRKLCRGRSVFCRRATGAADSILAVVTTGLRGKRATTDPAVTIESTRTGREIEAEPTRVEAIDEEEIDEKISMRPANVSMVLHESTGINVQVTSATSNTQSVRIQGVDGRYTQILKDGFPAYGGFSGATSILEIPPLDLKQVEVIKGPSATFFGQGAIAIKSAEQGTGLGLPIVQAILAKHNGEFILKSKLREGTEAIAILPAKRVLQSLPPVEEIKTVAPRRRSFA